MTNKAEIHLYTPSSYSKNGWIETREVPEKLHEKLHEKYRKYIMNLELNKKPEIIILGKVCQFC